MSSPPYCPPWYLNMFGLKHAGNRDVCGETATVVSLPVQSGPTLDVDGVLAYGDPTGVEAALPPYGLLQPAHEGGHLQVHAGPVRLRWGGG